MTAFIASISGVSGTKRLYAPIAWCRSHSFPEMKVISGFILLIFFIMLAINFFLRQFDLLHVHTGAVYGAGFTSRMTLLFIFSQNLPPLISALESSLRAVIATGSV